MSQTDQFTEDNTLYQSFDAYDFAADRDFSASLSRLIDQLAPSSDASTDAMTLKAKILHFSRTVSPIFLDAYKAWKEGELAPPSSSSLPPSASPIAPVANLPSHEPSSIIPEAAPPPPIPFQELAALIMQGRAGEVPILEVEEKVLDVPDEMISKVTDAPKKPWER